MYILLCIIISYLLLVTLLYICQRKLLYHPDSSVPKPSSHGLDEINTLRILTEDKLNLYAWWLTPKKLDSCVVLYLHGNAGNLGNRAEKVRYFRDEGFGVLMPTWRYNAGANGKPSEVGLIRDGRAAIDFLRASGVKDKQIVIYGESLGSGVAVALAAENLFGAIVLEAPFTSIPDVAQHHYWFVPTKWLVRDRFDSCSKIKKILAPLLIIHGDRDRIVPSRFGRRLYELASEPKEGVFLEYARHEDLFDHGASKLVLSFIKRHLG